MGSPYLRLVVPDPLRSELVTWSEAHVKDEALHEKGREQDPHITVFYGLPNSLTDVRRAMAMTIKNMRTIRTTITYSTYFRHSDKSVLVLACESAPLRSLVDAFNRATGATYKLNAHVTVAYVRKGQEPPSAGLLRFVGRHIETDYLEFVDADKVHHRIDL